MAFVTRNSLVAAIQGKLRFAVIEGGGLPTLGIVAGGAFRLLGFGELLRMNICVAGLAGHWSAFELDFLFPWKGFVTSVASDSSMGAKQGELCFRMVEPGHVNPGPGVMAGFAAERRAIRPATLHAVLEFPMMHIIVTTSAGLVFKVKRNDFVRSSRSADFMAFGTTHCDVGTGQRELGLPMLGDGKQRAVPIRWRVAALAAIAKRWFRKLAVVGVFVAVGARSKLHFVNRLLACGQMTLIAIYFCVLPFQRVL